MDSLPEMRPVLLSGLTWTEAKDGLAAVDCALRRPHWCSPIFVMIDGAIMQDDDGDLSPYRLAIGDRSARDWMMVPRPDDDGNEIEPTFRAAAAAMEGSTDE